MKLRIVLADDNSEVIRTITALLGDAFEVVGTAPNGRQALEVLRRCRPDVAILDLEMPFMNGIEITRELMKDGFKTAVVICSVESDPEIVAAAREAGAIGYVFKTRIAKDLVPAVESAAMGKPFTS
jgi:DNA-binding NarL/FixJ family response regulator